MFRYLVVHLPLFRIERCGWRAEDPVVLVAEEKNALRVQCASRAAHEQGVRPGMSSAEARALFPTLKEEMLDSLGEERDLDELALQLLRVSPSIAALHPDGLVAEIDRSSHLFATEAVGGERALLERVRIRLESLGHQARIAIADHVETARACARWGPSRATIVERGEDAAALAPLPLKALELPDDERSLLRGLGMRTVGDFATLPAASITARFGSIAVRAHAFARGEGRLVPLAPHEEDGIHATTQALPDPVTDLEALVFVLGSLSRDLALAMALANEAASRVVLRFGLEDGSDQCLSMRIGSPTRNAGRILDLLRHRLERFALAGPLVQVTLEAAETIPFQGRQGDLFLQDAQEQALGEVTALLRDALGAHAVGTPALENRHRPEAEWSMGSKAIGQQRLPLALDPGHRRTDGSDPVHEWRGRPADVRTERPPILLSPPIAVDAQPAKTPKKIRIDGRWLRVMDAEGPLELAGEWWSAGGFARSYWRMGLEDGRRAWVYEENPHRWVLHGWWDT